MSLRRNQWKKAEKGDTRMLIHLGEQWLDQRRKQDITSKGEAISQGRELTDDELDAALAERGLPTEVLGQ